MMGMQSPTAKLSVTTRTTPNAVYDALADLRTHLEWGGTRQSPDFRLLTLDAPAGPAAAGTTFSSSGTIPMSLRRWADRSTVTIAERPATFEFVTEARAGDRPGMLARYRHHYDIAAEGAGARVTYTLTELANARPMLRMSLPGIRQLTWRMAIPMYCSRGLRNLMRFAEVRASTVTRSQSGPAADLGSRSTGV